MEVRLFESSLLERLSRVHPRTPALFWVPVVLALCLVRFGDESHLPRLSVFGVGLGGLLFWSLFEYAVHRWIFHLSAKITSIQKVVFILHTNHHVVSQDRRRAMMPVATALLIATPLFGICVLAMGLAAARAFMAGFIVGYLAYDYLHFSFHHLDFDNVFWRHLKDRHRKHHQNHAVHFGVSTGLWDRFFGTEFTQ